MEKTGNTIRLNEQEFNKLIEESVKQVLSEGKFGDFAKKVGKGVGTAALCGALGAGSLYCLDKGLENQERYEQQLNKDARMQLPPMEDEVSQWLEDHNLEDTPKNREYAWDYLRDVSNHKNESKSHDRISQIIREEISKVL